MDGFDVLKEAAKVLEGQDLPGHLPGGHIHGDRAHISITLSLSVSHCPGDHPGEDSSHEGLLIGTEFVVIPPGDVQGVMQWPLEPGSTRELVFIHVMADSLLQELGKKVLSLPGAVAVTPHE